MQKNEQFFDSKTILAVILVGVVFFGWQSYLAKKYPQSVKTPVDNAESSAPNSPASSEVGTKKIEVATNEKQVVATDKLGEEKLIDFSYQGSHFVLSSYGMGFREISINEITDRNNQPSSWKYQDPLFSLFYGDDRRPIEFSITRSGDYIFEGVATQGGFTIKRRLEFLPGTQSFKNELAISGGPGTALFGLSMTESVLKGLTSSFLLPSFEYQEVLANSAGKIQRSNVSFIKDPVEQSFSAVNFASISSHYFTNTLIDNSDWSPEFKSSAKPNGDLIRAEVFYKLNLGQSGINLSFETYSGPKIFERLRAIDPQLEEVINFGFFSGIAKVLLQVMKWFHHYIGNWGWAIILLTVLVRLLVLPFNLASYKSMKKMQKIQPMIQSLRERYKEDPQTLNKEMMQLMKTEKVNPLGGCLPMLLQMPIFFALFQVFGQSIELYKAPFIFWISDLSLKDPFYVLPILMGASLWFQQKITPTTMDPAQARILQWMPVVFSLMMVTLPSGLTLYTFVSTLFGIIQQQIFMKDRIGTLRVSEAKA